MKKIKERIEFETGREIGKLIKEQVNEQDDFKNKGSPPKSVVPNKAEDQHGGEKYSQCNCPRYEIQGLSTRRNNQLEFVWCDICGPSKARLYRRAKSLYDDSVFDIVTCSRCGLIYVNPRIAEKERYIRNFSNECFLAEASQPTFRKRIIERQFLVARVRLWQISKYMSPKRLLDFGCAEGVLVYAALAKGWDAYGLELNEGLVQAAIKYWRGEQLSEGWENARIEQHGDLYEAAKIYCGEQRLFSDSLELFSQRHADSFDVISSFQVFEHLDSPGKTLSLLRKLLKKDGLIVVEVPNIKNWREILREGTTLNPTAHFYYFDRATLEHLLKDAGFKVLSIKAHITGLDIWEKIFRYLGLERFVPALSYYCGLLPSFNLGSNLQVIAGK